MSTPVSLYVYDLSNGLAKTISPFVLGRRIDGLWHTAIVVFGNEYFFGGHGIACCVPGTTQLGPPLKKEVLGLTSVTQDIFEEFLIGYSNSKFHGSSYNLLENNCNNFSDEVAKFLVGTGIDEDIVTLPQKVLNSPMGPMLKSHLEKMSNVAPTDSRNITRSNNTTIPNTQPHQHHNNNHHSNSNGVNGGVNGWETSTSSSLYFPCFSPVELTTEDIEAVKEVDPLLHTTIQHGPLTVDDLALLCKLHETNCRVFARVTALLSHKSGFIRLALGEPQLYSYIKATICSSHGGTEELVNNFTAGLNQAERCDEDMVAVVTGVITNALLATSAGLDSTVYSVNVARGTYNLAGCQLNEDQVFELGGAIIHSLPDNTDYIATDKRNVTKLDLILKALFLLMIKNRQVAELCTAMEKDLGIFRKIPELKGIVGKIVEL